MARRKTSRQTGPAEIASTIRGSFGRILAHPAFEAWKKDAELSTGDMIALNNSFVFRSGVGTRKNEQYLAVAVGKSGVLFGPRCNHRVLEGHSTQLLSSYERHNIMAKS